MFSNRSCDIHVLNFTGMCVFYHFYAMLCALCLFVTILHISSGSICNLEECENVTVTNGSTHYSLNSSDVVVLHGKADVGCRIEGISYSDESYLNVTVAIQEDILVLSVNYFSSDTKDTLVVILDQQIVYHDEAIDLSLTMFGDKPAFGGYYTAQKNHTIQYSEDVSDGFEIKLKVLAGQTSLSSSGCGDDFTVSLCPCKTPVVELERLDNNTLECRAAGIDGVTINWLKNNTNMENNNTVTKSDNINATSTLSNITITAYPTNYTCVAVPANTSSNMTPVSITLKEEDSEASIDGEPNGPGLLTYVISIACGVVVASAVTCVGVVKLAQHYAEKKRKTERKMTVPVQEMSSEEESSPPAIYAEVKRKGPARQTVDYNPEGEDDDDNIYNRLDPRTMTTRRDDFRTMRQPPPLMPPPPLKPPPPPTSPHFPSTAPFEIPSMYEMNVLVPGEEESNYEMNTLIVDRMY